MSLSSRILNAMRGECLNREIDEELQSHIEGWPSKKTRERITAEVKKPSVALGRVWNAHW